MAHSCCNHSPQAKKHTHKFKIALWIALVLNLSLFFIEVLGGAHTGSSALWADALDFAGDSFNYILSLIALGLTAYWRSQVALLKGLMMFIFALIIIGKVIWSYSQNIPPEALTMGLIGVLALVANIISAIVLYTFREGDANMRSVWLCSRNDAIGNIAVMIAALGVFGTNSVLPDLMVALVMAWLGLSSGLQIIKHAKQEQKA